MFRKQAYFALQCCDWTDYNSNFKQVMRVLNEQLSAGEQTSLIPFNALIFPIGIQDQLRIAQSHAKRHADVKPLAKKASSRKDGRLRVGYLSADFRDHPMGRDLSVLLLAHSSDATEVHCYAQNPPHKVHDGVFRQKMIQGVTGFHEVNHLSDIGAAELIQSHGIDVLVDLMGYTHGARDGVLALQPAAVQIAFKGYMSTTGARFISHLVSDAPSVPVELSRFYSERQLYLRPCFAASTHAVNHPETLDAGLESVSGEGGRQAAGLPTEGFVFACFNSLYKISPSLFDAWLKILKSVPGSHLWLLRAPAEAEAFLCKQATRRGVSCKRLLFTDKVEMRRHLLVKSNANLFLDTPIYNAHSTAADALWAAVPMVTLPREKMAARVGASLVMSLGLPELVVRNLDEYVSLAVTLAKRPKVLSALREKLKRRRTDPEHNGMFDVGRWIHAYESGIRMVYEVAVLQGRKGPRSHVIVTS